MVRKDALIKKVVLYNDKIEIHYKYTSDTTPDGSDSRREFLFYTYTMSFIIDQRKYDREPILLEFVIDLYV